jgi:PAS domain-containing protein
VRPKNKSITAFKGKREAPRESATGVKVTLDGRQYLTGIGVDFTERSLMEEALRESEERFKSLFENAVLGIYRTTPDGQILPANPALCKMLGCASLQELQQRNLEKDGFHPAYARSSYKKEIEKKGVIIGLEASWTTSDEFAGSHPVRQSRSLLDERQDRYTSRSSWKGAPCVG